MTKPNTPKKRKRTAAQIEKALAKSNAQIEAQKADEAAIHIAARLGFVLLNVPQTCGTSAPLLVRHTHIDCVEPDFDGNRLVSTCVVHIKRDIDLYEGGPPRCWDTVSEVLDRMQMAGLQFMGEVPF